MTWSKHDDGILDHAKIAAVGPIGYALYSAALVYANRNLTDGFIPFGVAYSLLSTRWTDEQGRVWHLAMTCGSAGKDGEELVEQVIGWLIWQRLWEVEDGGFRIHDFLDFNPSREKVLADRAKSAERQQRWKSRRDDAAGNGVTDTVTSPTPVPVPSSSGSSSRSASTRSTTPSARERAAAAVFEDSFWPLVPRKEEKAGARAKFVRLIRDGLEPDVLVEGMRRFAAQMTKEARPRDKVKIPTTWLNNGCWDDEYDDAPPAAVDPCSECGTDRARWSDRAKAEHAAEHAEVLAR